MRYPSIPAYVLSPVAQAACLCSACVLSPVAQAACLCPKNIRPTSARAPPPRRRGIGCVGLTPFIAAGEAIRPVNTEQPAAFGAGPFRLFLPDEAADAGFTDPAEIVQHTHSILRPVPLIQLPEACAGEAIAALGTIGGSTCGQAVALCDYASGAGWRFPAFRAGQVPAAGAAVLFPDVAPAEAAVHPAGRDQLDRDCRRNFFSGGFHNPPI